MAATYPRLLVLRFVLVVLCTIAPTLRGVRQQLRERRAEISPDAKILKPHGGSRGKVKTCLECQVFIDLAEMQRDADKKLDDEMKRAIEEGRRQSIKREMAREKSREGREQSGYPFYQKEDQDIPDELKKDQAVNQCLELPVQEQKKCLDDADLGVKTNKPRGAGGGDDPSAIPKLDIPSAKMPDLPDVPKLPDIPNVPSLKIPGIDALQKFLDTISAQIAALKPPKIPTLPTSISGQGRMGALGGALAPPPLTVGAGMGGGAKGALSTSFNPSQDASGKLPPPPPKPSLTGAASGASSAASTVGFKEELVSTTTGRTFRQGRSASGGGGRALMPSQRPPSTSLFESLVGGPRREPTKSPLFANVMSLLETMEKVGMVPDTPAAKRLMNPKLTAGTKDDPLEHPGYNKQRNHPSGPGTTNETIGAELFPVTSMHVCANEQNYGIHMALLKSLFKGLPLDQVHMECTPEFGFEEY